MTGRPSPRLRAYVTAGIVGLTAALAVGDPGPAVIGAPLLAIGMLGLVGGAAPAISAELGHVPRLMIEGEEREIVLDIAVDEPVGRIYVDLGLEGLDLVRVDGGRLIERSTVAIGSIRDSARIRAMVAPRAWGHRRVGPLTVYMDSPLGLFDLRYSIGESRHVIVVPGETTLKTVLSPLETNLHVGDLVSKRRGAGSEFADLRPYRHGDDPRTLNWRVSSRAQALWVNERHPERNGDVLLLVDAQVEPGSDLGALIDRSVRMTAALLSAHARRHHRLGLVTLDGLCRWIYPGMGEAHRHRLMEQLMGVHPGEVVWEAAERAVIRAARSPSMVIALTPLADPNLAGLIHSLRVSGIDVSVIQVGLDPVLPPPTGSQRVLGRRLWDMERARLRERLVADGVPVVVWREIDPPDVPISQLGQWRKSWHRLG